MTLESNEEVPSEASRQLPANVRVLGWTSLVNDIASEAVYPLLPTFLKGLGATNATLGLIEGVVDTLSSLLKMWIGKWSDQVGKRKQFLLLGYGLTVFARPWIGLVNSVGAVLGLRMIDRVGKGIRTSPRDAMIALSVPESMRGRAFGYHRSMDHLGAAMGPLLATIYLMMFPGQIRSLFLWTLVPGLVLLVILSLGLREVATVTSSSNAKPIHDRSRYRPGFRPYLAAVMLFALANSTDAFLLVRAREVGVGVEWLPMLWAMLQLLKFLGNRVGGYWADRVSPKRLLMLGWLFYAMVYGLFGLADATWQIGVLFAMYSLFYSASEPSEKKLVSLYAEGATSGAAFGWFHMIIGLASLPSSLLFGAVYDSAGPVYAFGLGSFLAVLAMLVLMAVPAPRGEEQHAT
ncbi:MAG: MFS transporter [Pirellulales bacterium]